MFLVIFGCSTLLNTGFERAEQQALCEFGIVIDFHSDRLFVSVIFDTAKQRRNVHIGYMFAALLREN